MPPSWSLHCAFLPVWEWCPHVAASSPLTGSSSDRPSLYPFTWETSKAGLQCPAGFQSLWHHCAQKGGVRVPQRSGVQGVRRGVLPQHKNGVPGMHHDPLGWPQVFSCPCSLSLPFSLSYFPSFNYHPRHLRSRPFTAWPCTLPPAFNRYSHTGLLASPEHNTCSGSGSWQGLPPPGGREFSNVHCYSHCCL